MSIIDNDLLSIQEARILIENSKEAGKKLATFPQEKIDEIVGRMLEEVEKYNEELARIAYEETECGNIKDKLIKDKFIIKSLREKFQGMKCIGVIEEDKKNKTIDIGVPIGVVVVFCPMTSPVSTTIYKAAIAVKSGNSVVFVLNKKAKKSMQRTLDILIRAAEGYGLPEGALSYLSVLSEKGYEEIVNHKETSLIINTGNSELLSMCYKSGKSVIYGGVGNGPAFIERTANIKKAVKDIIKSKSFDNGIVSGAEQSIVVDAVIQRDVEEEMVRNGAYFMSEDEALRLGNLLFKNNGELDQEFIGKTPQFLAKRAGFNITNNIKLLVSRQKYVSLDNPHSKEKLCPVISYYVENDWMNACEKCIELLLSEREGHTLVIHSSDSEVIKQFSLKKPVGRILVNTSGVFGSMGATTNLFPAMTLGSGLVGKGMTSDNVSPMNLIYIRKVGYEVCETEVFLEQLESNKNENVVSRNSVDIEDNLKNVLLKILSEIKE